MIVNLLLQKIRANSKISLEKCKLLLLLDYVKLSENIK